MRCCPASLVFAFVLGAVPAPAQEGRLRLAEAAGSGSDRKRSRSASAIPDARASTRRAKPTRARTRSRPADPPEPRRIAACRKSKVSCRSHRRCQYRSLRQAASARTNRPDQIASIEPAPAKPADKKAEDKTSEAAAKPVSAPVTTLVPLPPPAPSRPPDKPAAAKSASIALPSAKPTVTARNPSRSRSACRHSAGERLKIQLGAAVGGRLSRRTASDGDPLLTAIKNFQKRNKAKITGVLTPSERADAGRRRRQRTSTNSAGAWWSIRRPASASACRPSWCRTRARPRMARAGRRAHGEVQVETFRIKDPKLKLSALFEREKKQPANAQGRAQRACTTTISSSAACRG